MTLEKSKSMEAGLHTILTETTTDSPEITPSSPAPPVSFCAKARLIATNITVEPILILYVLPSVMASLAVQNLTLEKACRVKLALSEEVCDALTVRNASGYSNADEVAVQTIVANLNAWKNVVQSLIPSALLLFLGSWSDRSKRRKPCIIVPIIGEICSSVGFLLCTYFFYELPMEFNAFFEAVPPAVTGGWFAVFLGVFSYISGVSSVETRTFRIGAVNSFSNISITIGIALSGILYKEIGFYGVFSLAVSMYVTGLTYGVCCVREKTLINDVNQSESDSSTLDGKTKKVGFFKDFFDWKHVVETFRVAFKQGARNRRKRIYTIMVLVMVIIGPLHGEMSVMYLFVRYKFGWNEIDYSLFSTFQFVFYSCGTIFSLVFFSKFLKMDDAVLGMISSASKICACMAYSFAPNGMFFYIASLVEVLSGTSFIAMRSIMSKLVPEQELGKINSIFGVCEALMPLIYGPMYSYVYKKTIKFFPGAFFVLGGVLTMPAIIIFFWLYREHQRDLLEDEKEKAQKEALLKMERIETSPVINKEDI